MPGEARRGKYKGSLASRIINNISHVYEVSIWMYAAVYRSASSLCILNPKKQWGINCRNTSEELDIRYPRLYVTSEEEFIETIPSHSLKRSVSEPKTHRD